MYGIEKRRRKKCFAPPLTDAQARAAVTVIQAQIVKLCNEQYKFDKIKQSEIK